MAVYIETTKKFKTGDVVVDTYNRHGIVIKYDSHRKDTLLLLIKNGDYYNTLESLEHNWAWVDYYDEFKQILKSLGESNNG
jgi:hypothetical protein